MDEVRSLLGEFFFVKKPEKESDAEKEKMKYPKRYHSLSDFEREELCSYKVSWSIDDFFDEVFLSGEMDLEYNDEGSAADDDLDDLED